jgi:hypothetical protein
MYRHRVRWQVVITDSEEKPASFFRVLATFQTILFVKNKSGMTVVGK